MCSQTSSPRANTSAAAPKGPHNKRQTPFTFAKRSQMTIDKKEYHWAVAKCVFIRVKVGVGVRVMG